jgi:Holliday junction resolvase
LRKRPRLDSNHNEIRQALEKMGWGVKSMAGVGDGFVDLLAVKAGRIVLIEVKDGDKVPSKRKLTEDECETHHWFSTYGVEVILVTCIADLMILDRESRSVHEGVPPRNMYE